MFSAISAIATLKCSGNAVVVASTGRFWLLFFTAVPLLLVCLWRTPDTYHTAGLERGTATSTSTRPGTTSALTKSTDSGKYANPYSTQHHLRSSIHEAHGDQSRHYSCPGRAAGSCPTNKTGGASIEVA